jgi:hypothetical protein
MTEHAATLGKPRPPQPNRQLSLNPNPYPYLSLDPYPYPYLSLDPWL